MSECWKLKAKNEKVKPSACVVPNNVSKDFSDFCMEGEVSLVDHASNPQPITIVRDTCCAQTLILDSVLPFSDSTKNVLIKGVGTEYMKVPLHEINLKSNLVSGPVTVGVMSKLPIDGAHMLLGNDLAGKQILPGLIISDKPCTSLNFDTEDDQELYPVCAVTRSMTKISQEELVDEVKKAETSGSQIPDLNSNYDLENTFLASLYESEAASEDPISRNKLLFAQSNDPELVELEKRSLPPHEFDKVPVCLYKEDDILMRKWRPPDVAASDDWSVLHQIVVPTIYRREVMSLAHEHPMAGHLGVNKTYERINTHFWWPTLKRDVSEFCKSCPVCQIVGKPNQKIPRAPLQPIPAFQEPFSRIIIDCVGPLPKTKSGNQYLLTIMCAATRFPEAIPLRNIKSPTIVRALIKFFTLFGLPQSVQSDQGSNFMSGLSQQVMHELGITQYKSSAYHPESQGALERFHQTLKNMMRSYCFEFQRDWDEGVHLLLFAAREAVQESLGFSPFELVFGHRVRGPLQLLKEKWLNNSDKSDLNLLDYVSGFKTRLVRAGEIAKENLKDSQTRMKVWYDRNAKSRVFEPGEKVLVLFPIPGDPLRARYSGPYEIETKLSDVNYVVKTPGRRKQRQLCHINMLKKYVDRDSTNTVKPVAVTVSGQSCDDVTEDITNVDDDNKFSVVQDNEYTPKLANSEVLANLDTKLCHLDQQHQNEVTGLIHEFPNLCSDVPTHTDFVHHDVDVGGASPIKRHPYRLNPEKTKYLDEEVKYMLDNNIIEPSSSDWSSPCVLVPKPNGTYRVCQDFRMVNAVTKADSFPIPRIEDCIDKVGRAKYVSKFDLLKGYWQVPLTDRAKEISAFVTSKTFYQFRVMPFGMKNAPATFQRLVNRVIDGIDGCQAYIDDLVVYADTWDEHMKQLHKLFERLTEANLTINLIKSDFCHATVTYLGHVVGQGQIKPIRAKVEAIEQFPQPPNKKALQRFLGMAGCYRKYCPNFSVVAYPMTNLLKKTAKFVWCKSCTEAFNKIKAILKNSPVLSAPDFERQFYLAVDASDVGCGAVFTQILEDEIEHPIGYFSKKFDRHQRNYSTIEKECLGILLALQHFEVYLNPTKYPVVVYTDHNPLTFLQRMRNKNQRLLRWSLALQEYNLQVTHIKGKDNVIADALSRVS